MTQRGAMGGPPGWDIPKTIAGRNLAVDLSNRHDGSLVYWDERVAEIEDNARRLFLDELIYSGAVTTPMSYDEMLGVTTRLERMMERAASSSKKVTG